MSNITEIEVGGVPRKIEDAQARDDILLLLQQTNGLYRGRDLTIQSFLMHGPGLRTESVPAIIPEFTWAIIFPSP